MENTLTLLLQDPSLKWYAVVNNRPIGPLAAKEVVERIKGGELSYASHVWKDGLRNWTRIYDVPDFQCLLPTQPAQSLIAEIQKSAQTAPPPLSPKQKEELRTWYVFVDETQYGPFSDPEMHAMIEAGRVTVNTYVWQKGFSDWQAAGQVPPWSGHLTTGSVAAELAKKVNQDKRTAPRKPFEAKILLTDGKEVGWAICRDISIGGMQVLMDQVPKTGSQLKLNVGAIASIPGFTCEGEVVRILEDGRGFSFRFHSLPANAKSAIEKYISQG